MPFERAGSTGPRVRARSARMWGGGPVRSKTTAQDASGTAIVSSVDLSVPLMCDGDEPIGGLPSDLDATLMVGPPRRRVMATVGKGFRKHQPTGGEPSPFLDSSLQRSYSTGGKATRALST